MRALAEVSVMRSDGPAVATIIGAVLWEVPTVVDIVGIGYYYCCSIWPFHQGDAAGKLGPRGTALSVRWLVPYFSLLQFLYGIIYQHKISPHSLRAVRAGRR